MVAGVSSLTISSSLRQSLTRMQADLVGARKEATTGRVADVGLALGGSVKQSVTLARDLERAKSLVDTNTLAAARLSGTQSALGDLAKNGQALLQTLTTSLTGSLDPAVLRTAATNALSSMTGVLNTAINGEYIFGGINTGEQPIRDYDAAGSPAKAAFATAFSAHFGFGKNDAQAADINPGAMNGFLDALAADFAGAGWTANWSNSTDEGIETPIGLNETARTSLGANDAGIRDFAFAASVIAEVFDSHIGPSARGAVVTRASEVMGRGVGGIAAMQARLGLTEQRVWQASERLTAQADLFETQIQSLEGIDVYEASTRVTSLMTQIENSYALTARMQQLSLMRYLT